jgi:prevent-host-death family protein
MTRLTKSDTMSDMSAIPIHEAKTQFSRLIARAEAGEVIVVRRGSTPVAKIIAYSEPVTPRRPGGLKGSIELGEDFAAPLDDFADYVA